MITYVNTVLVSNKGGEIVSGNPTTADAGKFVVMYVGNDNLNILSPTDNGKFERVKIGLVTSKTTRDMKGNVVPVIKWSNIINKRDLKSYTAKTYTADTEDVVKIDFTGASAANLAKGNKRIVLRVTYKDLPTRFRKWTESYEYVTTVGDTATIIASKFAEIVSKEWKRARVNATASAGVLTLTALPYDDDNTVDTINWAGKVRFSANVYYTNPDAPGFASKNKYSINGLKITRTPGIAYQASAKLVRDREAQAMGYEGILNRGEGTWPIIKPDMNTDLSVHYDSMILEFENMYRAADDIFRKTKQTLEIYINTDATNKGIVNWIKTFAVNSQPNQTSDSDLSLS